MDRLFRVDMYPADWLIDTSSLEADECGLYIQIVMLIYAKRGPIENNPEELARKLKNMSIRKCRALVNSLVEKRFLTITSNNFITQKRAESELKSKRTHLETSARGGRNKAENERERRKNNDLGSSDTTYPLPSSYPTPPPTATASAVNTLPILPNKTPLTQQGGEGFKSENREGKIRVWNMDSVQQLFGDDVLGKLQDVLRGLDKYTFFQDYAAHLNKNGMPNNPSIAVLHWANKWASNRKTRR